VVWGLLRRSRLPDGVLSFLAILPDSRACSGSRPGSNGEPRTRPVYGDSDAVSSVEPLTRLSSFPCKTPAHQASSPDWSGNRGVMWVVTSD